MITTFYLLSFLFIWMQLYYLSNINRLDKRFLDKDIMSMSKFDLFYYITRVLYWIWIPLGLILGNPVFWFIIYMSFIKLISFHINKKFYKFWNLLMIPFSIVTMIVIFVDWLV